MSSVLSSCLSNIRLCDIGFSDIFMWHSVFDICNKIRNKFYSFFFYFFYYYFFFFAAVFWVFSICFKRQGTSENVMLFSSQRIQHKAERMIKWHFLKYERNGGSQEGYIWERLSWCKLIAKKILCNYTFALLDKSRANICASNVYNTRTKLRKFDYNKEVHNWRNHLKRLGSSCGQMRLYISPNNKWWW